VVTFDLHGNLSQKQIDKCNAAVAYRTCPHVDQKECGLRAAAVLNFMLRHGLRPVQALVKPPLIVNIMAHDTSCAPLHSFMEEIRERELQPGIERISFLPGFAYADAPQMGPSILVVTNGDRSLADREAGRLAEKVWNMREQLAVKLPDAATAVTQALTATRLPAVLVDTGDNVGGGSAADGTIILKELLRQGATDSVVCLFDPESAQQCAAAGVGQELNLLVGGKVDHLHGNALSLTGRVRVLHDGVYTEFAVRHGGRRLNQMGLTALVETQGRNLLVLNSQRHPPFSLGQLTCLGIQPAHQRILVVKAAIAYKAAYAPLAGTIVEVDTPGLTAVNPERFAYRHIRRPMFPLDR
jgi:microcystin degradation protein MlrC